LTKLNSGHTIAACLNDVKRCSRQKREGEVAGGDESHTTATGLGHRRIQKIELVAR